MEPKVIIYQGGVDPSTLDLPSGTWTVENSDDRVYVSGDGYDPVCAAAAAMGLDLSSGVFAINVIERDPEDLPGESLECTERSSDSS